MKPSTGNEDSRSAWDPPAPSRPSNARTLIVVGVIVGVAVAAFFTLFAVRSTVKQAVVSSGPVAQTSSSESVLVEFEKLKGKWLRPDGGYVLELKRLLDQNALEAAYFNPNPIHVGSAKLYKERGFVKVFVKLQDVNYPGSTYTLIYDVGSDQLRGIYYQAVQQQEFDVAFERLPPGS